MCKLFAALKFQGNEKSSEHKKASIAYFRRKNNNILKDQLLKQICKERNYWRDALGRVTAVICTLIRRNVAIDYQ